MNRVLPQVGVALIALLTLGVGVLHGKLSNRWGQRPDLNVAGERVRDLPTVIGEWELRSNEELSEAIVDVLQCTGYVNRVYVHRKTGETISLAVLLGPPGPISVHTPEVCYPAQNLEVFEPAENQQVREDKPDESFAAVTFRSRGLEQERLRVWYAWNRGERWQAPSSPRMAFSGAPMLFKIQVATRLEGEGTQDTDACRDFLKDALPVFDQALFAAKGMGAGEGAADAADDTAPGAGGELENAAEPAEGDNA